MIEEMIDQLRTKLNRSILSVIEYNVRDLEKVDVRSFIK